MVHRVTGMRGVRGEGLGQARDDSPGRIVRELLAAGVGEALSASGIRYLLIKGLVPERRGLRQPKESADVDVLVLPSDREGAIAALRAWGWKSIAESGEHGARAPHAETLIHDGWPVTVDLHHRFPGFTGGAERAFEALWESRVPIRFAAAEQVAPDRVGTAAVEALNAMRTHAGASNASRQRAAALKAIAELDDCERQELAFFAKRAGAQHVLGPLLAGEAASEPTNADELAWDLLLSGSGPFVARATADVYMGHGMERLSALMRVVWPPTAVFVETYGMDGASRARVLRERIARMARGAAKAPKAVGRALNMARRHS